MGGVLIGSRTGSAALRPIAGCRTESLRGWPYAPLTLGVALVSASAAVGVRDSDDVSQSWTRSVEDVQLGRWLRTLIGRPARIMDTGPTVAYYARGVLVSYPWTDSETALRYASEKKVDCLILRERNRKLRPYFEEWIRSGLDGRAKLIHTFHRTDGDIVVYRWRDE